MEGVALRFTDTALAAIAKEAIKRKTGARGLRAIVEELMLDVMYDLPGKTGVRECVVTDEVVARKKDPILVYENATG
jgi:ATP-dependent Clp protease ATP-binding subunit ClpX